MDSKSKKTGFTFVEIIVVVALLIIISVVILGVFRSFDETEALNRSVADVVSLLEVARQQTLFSKDSSRYGVKFYSDRAVLFKGQFFSTTSPNNLTTKLHSKIFISNIGLPGGTTTVSFKRLTGETDQNGTIILESRIDSSKIKTITVDKTGLVK